MNDPYFQLEKMKISELFINMFYKKEKGNFYQDMLIYFYSAFLI